jgi:hypothetical protein
VLGDVVGDRRTEGGGVVDVRFRPLDRWPLASTPADKRRSRWTFKAAWGDTLALLEDELAALNATDVVIEVALRPEEIRLDGWPRAGANPSHPGVAVSFTSKYGPLRYITDRHEFWQHNVRAIALGLQALRAVDRYGITHRAEQYKGWAALPAGTDHAMGVLFAAVGEDPRALENAERERLYRRAVKAAHPDTGGDAERFREVQAAAEALGLRS